MQQPIGAIAALVAGAILLSGCTPDDTRHASGSVDVHTAAVAAPALLAVTPDPDAGFSPSAAEPRPAAAVVAAVRVTDAAALGTHVRAGEAVAHVDGAAQDAALAAARADADLAAARVTLLESQAAELADRRAEARTKRADVLDAIDALNAKRPELVTTRDDLVARRTEVRATIASLTARQAEARAARSQLAARRDAAAQLPDSPQRQAATAPLEAALAQADTGLGQLDAGLTRARQGLAHLQAGINQVVSGLATLDTNLATARDGLARLDDALAELADAARAVDDAHTLAVIAVTAAGHGVARAEQQASSATLVAPTDGIVVATTPTGTVLAPGAPVVTIRPDAAASVTAWLPADAAAGLCPGQPVTVTADWAAAFSATVDRLGVTTDYPPTTQATDDVHLTRAVPVTFTLDAAATPPPGAPVDLTWTPCEKD